MDIRKSSVKAAEDDLLQRLQQAFDQTFAESPAQIPERHSFVAIEVAGRSFAIALEDIRVLLLPQDCVPVPSQHPAFIGLLGHRGELFPTYALAHFVGSSPTPGPHWFVLTQGTPSVAFAFARHLGFFSLTAQQLYQAQELDVVNPFVEQVAHPEQTSELQSTYYPILQLSYLVERIQQDLQSTSSTSEI